ncbi:MAG: hypothetical protein FD168_2281 [Desulfobulbaceae bacterium]|jgi:hypothetical protein|nr:MAG: hypothetical protein FD168_2281 [Desulfobulbaceae bacterium]
MLTPLLKDARIEKRMTSSVLMRLLPDSTTILAEKARPGNWSNLFKQTIVNMHDLTVKPIPQQC